jgi:hypothetical protein
MSTLRRADSASVVASDGEIREKLEAEDSRRFQPPNLGKQPQHSREREIGEETSILRCFQSKPPAGPRPRT